MRNIGRSSSLGSSRTSDKPVNPFDSRTMAERERQFAKVIAEMKERGVRNIQVELVDSNSIYRGKIAPVSKIKPAGFGFSTAIYCLTFDDEFFELPYSNFENGFPNITAVPDLDSLVQWPWQPDMGSVVLDVYEMDGSPCMLDPRQLLRSVENKSRAMGFEAKFAAEIEFRLFHADEDLMLQHRYRELKPYGGIPNAYALHRAPSFTWFAKEFQERMSAIGVEIDGMHTELGPGTLEYAVSPLPALQAADAAMRSKLYLKQLAAEHGLVASFMTKYHEDWVSTGGHHHMSLWQNGRPAFHDPVTNDLSEVGRQFVAGTCKLLPETQLVYRPTANTYRRHDITNFNPENNSWGYDHRSTAIRFIKGTTPSQFRFENRTPGSDVNSYLSIAMMLAAGLYGIENRLEPLEAAKGNPMNEPRWTALPNTLKGSIETFKSSHFAREWFGDAWCETFARKCETELAGWMKQTDASKVTDWEYKRYFESA